MGAGARALLSRGRSSGESRRGEEEGGYRRRLCRRSASAPRSRHAGMRQEDLSVDASGLSLPEPPLPRSPRARAAAPAGPYARVRQRPRGVEGESPADFCQCAASSGPSPQTLGRGHLERGSCPLLCLQFPSGCLVSVNHPTKANTAGKDRGWPSTSRSSRPGDPRLWDGSHPAGSWMLAIGLGLPGRGPKGEQETLFPMDTD